MLVKLYGNDPKEEETRYSPAECIGCQTAVMSGRPDPKHVALHYMYYNFCRIHQTLRVTPAMEAVVTDHVWSIEEIADLLDSK